MSLRDAIAALVAAAPADATVTVRWLGELLGADGTMSTQAAESVDLTVSQLADLFGRGASTVRMWLDRGDFPGAYKLHDREWRVPPASLAAMQAQQAAKHRQPIASPSTHRTADLGEWRKHIPKTKAS